MSKSNTGKGTRKTCSACGRRRPLRHFRKCWGPSSDGLKGRCVDCQRIYEKDWRGTHKATLIAAREKRREKDKIYRRKYIEKDRATYLVSGIARRCKKKGMPFDLDQYIEELNARIAPACCELTGLPLRMKHGKRAWNSPSLDRVKPGLGYIYSNIRVVCFAVNAALGDWGDEVLRTIASAYLERNA